MKDLNTIPVITIDGPSGTGKGTVSLMLANHLKWHYLDSGAIYRVLAYAVSANNIAPTDVPAIVKLAKHLNLKFEVSNDLICRVFLDGQDVSAEIREEGCGNQASIVAAIPEVRAQLLQRQRDFAAAPGLITDGRDMGTVVFPNATIKIFLNASVEERARRRYLQLKNIQDDVNLAQVVDRLAERDTRDAKRTCAPLRAADDALHVDTTTLSAEQAFDCILQSINERMNQC